METLIPIVILSLLSAIFGTVTGFGSSTIMVPVLALFLPLPQTLLFAGIVHFFVDIWKVYLFRGKANWRLIFQFGIPGTIFAVIGATFAVHIDQVVASHFLAFMIVAYSIFIIVEKRWKIRPTLIVAVAGGSLSGLAAGMIGLGGAIRTAFISMFNLPKEQYLFTAGGVALFIDLSRNITYLANGVRLDNLLVMTLVLSVFFSFLGSLIASKIVHRIDQKYFRVTIALFLVLAAIKFAFFP